jgi:hypothetical protein
MHNDNTYRTETPLMTALFVASELGVRVPILKFISIYFAELVFGRDWNIVKGSNDIESLLIKRYCKDKRSFNVLRSYTREALYKLIETEWIFINPQELLPEGGKRWAYSYIPETQELSLDGFILKKDNFPKKEFAKCGTVSYGTDPMVVHRRETIEQLSTSNPIKTEMVKLYDQLVEARKKANRVEDMAVRAKMYSHEVKDMMDKVRENADNLEMLIDDEMWTLPKYRELLFF